MEKGGHADRAPVRSGTVEGADTARICAIHHRGRRLVAFQERAQDGVEAPTRGDKDRGVPAAV